MRKNIIDENFVNELCKSGVWDVAKVDLGSVNESSEVEDTDEVSARELAEELFENLSDDIIYECIDILHSTLLNEEDDLDEQTLIEDALQEMDDNDFDSLVNEAIAVLDEEYDLSEATEEDLIEAIIDELDISMLKKTTNVGGDTLAGKLPREYTKGGAKKLKRARVKQFLKRGARKLVGRVRRAGRTLVGKDPKKHPRGPEASARETQDLTKSATASLRGKSGGPPKTSAAHDAGEGIAPAGTHRKAWDKPWETK